ncbi:MAG: cytochrome c [Rhodospirillales bacterium]|nr:cytochrome c [Rhodospirillales bacterium]
MKRLLGSTIIAGALVAALGWGAANVAAEQDPKAVIKDRQDTMKAQGKALAAAKGFSEGRVDQATAEAAISDLIKTTSRIVDKFPPGTGMAEFPGVSGAKPAIWTEWDKFKAAPQAAVAQEQKLLALIKAGDKQAVGAQSAATWDDGCQVCHKPYREKL